MFTNSAFEKLRQRIDCLEETQRRFARAIPVASAVDCRLPHGGLPAGCIHEVKGTSLASAIAFSAILAARIAGDQGNILYIAPDRSLYPLGLLSYGVKLRQILHVLARKPQDAAWTVMEALRCSQVSAVMAVIEGLDLTESRRLQIASETSGATGLLLGHANSAAVASPITRWKVSSATGKAGQRFDEPVWELDLLYCRGGRPGRWVLEWRDQKLIPLHTRPAISAYREALAG